MLTSGLVALSRRADDVAGGEERRPDDRRADRPRRLRVTGRRGRLEQVRLVAETEHPVVVHEIDVAIEGQRAQVGEVVEAVALEPRPELKLEGETDREEPGKHQRGAPARGGVPVQPRQGDRRHGRHDHEREHAGRMTGEVLDTSERRATSRAQSSTIAPDAASHPSGRQKAPPSGIEGPSGNHLEDAQLGSGRAGRRREPRELAALLEDAHVLGVLTREFLGRPEVVVVVLPTTRPGSRPSDRASRRSPSAAAAETFLRPVGGRQEQRARFDRHDRLRRHVLQDPRVRQVDGAGPRGVANPSVDTSAGGSRAAIVSAAISAVRGARGIS